MTDIPVELLARVQFAMTAAFHYLYPPLSIGLGVYLVVIEGIYLRTKNLLYKQMAKFWTKVFALTFALGVATGIVLEFEFGTNWAVYSRYVGDIFGSALAAEGIFAFFLESGFLALLLFGWNRIGPKLHFLSTCMVCLGAHFSAIWIVVANSWMHTPAGFKIVGEFPNERAEITDFWAMVFNPSAMDRLSHVISGCWQAGAWLVISVSAFYILKNRHVDFARHSLKWGLVISLVSSILQLVTGSRSAEYVTKYQPPKLAAMEGVFETQERAPLYLFGWVDIENEKVHGLAIPGLLSFLAHGDVNAPVTGLKDIPRDEWPPVQATFQFYHAMVAIGMGLLGLAVVALWAYWRGWLVRARWLLWVLVFSVLGPQLANQFGWWTAEIGRQPWIVWGLLRTSDALSQKLESSHVLFSIILFAFIYTLLFLLFIYLLNKKIQHGPEPAEGPIFDLKQFDVLKKRMMDG